MLFCIPGDMSKGQPSSREQCHLAELLSDLTVAEQYAYGRTDWDVSAAEDTVGIGTQLLRYCSYQYF